MVNVTKETEEEKKKKREEKTRLGKEAGQAFIREREKALSKGAGKEEAARFAEERTKDIGTEAFVPGAAEELRTEREEAATLPERVELDVTERGPIQKIPVVGAGITAISNLLSGAANGFDKEIGPEFGFETKNLLIQDPQTVRDIALQEIQKETLKEGISVGEGFGTFVESIPIVGGLVSKYAGGLIETPSANADTVLRNILNEKERALNTAEMVRSGRLDPVRARERLDLIEDNIARLEQRLKLLAEISPTLQADPDTINRFETEILRTRERIEDARTSAFERPPTDMEIFLELQRLQRGEDE